MFSFCKYGSSILKECVNGENKCCTLISPIFKENRNFINKTFLFSPRRFVSGPLDTKIYGCSSSLPRDLCLVESANAESWVWRTKYTTKLLSRVVVPIDTATYTHESSSGTICFHWHPSRNLYDFTLCSQGVHTREARQRTVLFRVWGLLFRVEGQEIIDINTRVESIVYQASW